VESDQLSRDLASLKIDRGPTAKRSAWRLMRVVWIAIVLGALAAVAWFVVYPKLTSAFLTVEVKVGDISMVSPEQAQVKLTATGYVVALTSAKVAAKVPGRIAELFVDEGDTIEKGAKVARLEDVDFRSGLAASHARGAAARSKVAIARAQLAELKVQIDREKPLVANGVDAKATLDDLQTRYESQTASVSAALAEASAADAETHSLETQLGSYIITTPISGTVVTKLVQVGEGVSPGFGTPGVVEVVDMQSLVVEVDVPENRLAQVEPDAPCEIVLDADPTKRYRGSVKEIGHRVNRSKATVPVKIRFVDRPTIVLPEMAARVSFLAAAIDAKAAAAPSKLVVPAAAVVQRNGADVIFIFDDADGDVRMSTVKVGAALGDDRELETAIPAGTKVVLNPPANLGDGQKVKEKK
jgi:RND family efflux transporter MFP subunit